jgi:hypothetical protein
MSDVSTAILGDLQTVDQLRAERRLDPALSQRVDWVKTFQQQRFEDSYADLLRSPRYAGAARFFLDELYGPADFSHRDAQFARVVPGLVRLFPNDVVATVATLGKLHALSESMDSRMAQALRDVAVESLDGTAYGEAWRSVGEPDSRQAQIELTLEVGRQLDRFTRSAWLRHSLRLMRGPAKAAGLEQLQRFLEAGFDTFAEMKGAQDFLSTIRAREENLARALFEDTERFRH